MLSIGAACDENCVADATARRGGTTAAAAR